MSETPTPTTTPGTRMVQDPQRSKLISPDKPAVTPDAKKKPKVWIRAIRPIRVSDNQTLVEGQVALVSAKAAREFCDKKFDNAYPFTGERREADAPKLGVIVRAERISEEEGRKIEAKMKADLKAKGVDDDDDDEDDLSA